MFVLEIRTYSLMLLNYNLLFANLFQSLLCDTILAVGIYAKKKKVHLLTINVQITAYKQLNTWYDLSGPQLQQPSFWASICKEI